MTLPKIIFYSEATSLTGSGHLARMVDAANYFTIFHSGEFITSLATSNTLIAQKFASDWYPNCPPPQIHDFSDVLNGNWSDFSNTALYNLINLPRKSRTEVLIIDGKFNWSPEDWEHLNRRFDIIISIDNLSSLNTIVHASLFPTNYLPLIYHTKDVYTGEAWQWLNPLTKKTTQPLLKKYDFSIFMGGSDPNNLTLLAIEDIYFKFKELKNVLVILGPMYQHQNSLQKFEDRVLICKASNNYLESLLLSKVTLCAFGLSSIELSYLQQPTILYTHNAVHLGDATDYLNHNTNESILRSEWLQGKEPIENIKLKILPQFNKNLYSLVLKLLDTKND